VLAGGVSLDTGSARQAVGALASQLGMDVDETALGIIEVVQATMERAVRAVSVEEGADPREAALVAFGGAGGLHAVALARRLEMAAVIVPPHAGVFSALGLLLTPPRADHWRTVLTTDIGTVEATLARLATESMAELGGGTGAQPVDVDVVVDVRYVGQSHETPVPYATGEGWETLTDRFHRIHAERNGFSRSEDPVEAVAVRVAAVGAPSLLWDDLPVHAPTGPDRLGRRPVITEAGELEVESWWRPGLAVGAEVTGPCLFLDGESTTWLGAGDRGVVLASGALEVTW
jgi:N-methylhydantoinase A